VAGLARHAGVTVEMDGLVSSLDGRTVIRGKASGAADRAEAVGERLADELLARGARTLLDEGAGR
jgi:hydroxymethylbilane synthase